MAGLKRGTVALAPYDVAWRGTFETELQALRKIFGREAEAIEHIGSTAVPGIVAKPIIDIEVGLRDFALWRQFIKPFEKAGYTFMPERVGVDEVFMPKGPEKARTHYLHITQFASPEWQKVILFRDALRRSESLRNEYAQLKKALADQFPGDRRAYSHGKIEFIQAVVKESK